jgi:hypothetical protein
MQHEGVAKGVFGVIRGGRDGKKRSFGEMGTRADDEVDKRMRLKLTGAYRKLHNELHKRGQFHEHSPMTDHDEHHGESMTSR